MLLNESESYHVLSVLSILYLLHIYLFLPFFIFLFFKKNFHTTTLPFSCVSFWVAFENSVGSSICEFKSTEAALHVWVDGSS